MSDEECAQPVNLEIGSQIRNGFRCTGKVEMNAFSGFCARLVASIRYAWILNQMEDLTAQQSYEEALTKLHIAEKIHSDLEIRIRKAHLQFATGDFRGSIAISLLLHSDIEEDNGLSEGNKKYLNEYVLGLWESASEF